MCSYSPASREQMVAGRSFCLLRTSAGLPRCPSTLRKVQGLPSAPLGLTMEPLSGAYAGQLEELCRCKKERVIQALIPAANRKCVTEPACEWVWGGRCVSGGQFNLAMGSQTHTHLQPIRHHNARGRA